MKPLWLIGAVILAGILAWRRRRLEPALLAGGGFAAVAMAVYATGLIHLPDLAVLLEDVGRALGPWTYLLVGLAAFLEAAAFAGLLVPGETTILVGGMVAGQGEIDLIVLIAIAWSMAFLGDLTGYALGRRLGRPFLLRHGPRFGINESRIEQVDEFFAVHGGKAIFIGRFVGLVRSLSPFLAGSSKMPLSRFVPYDILGSGLQSTLLCLVGYFFWQSFDRVIEFVERGALALGSTIAVVTALIVIVRWMRVAENRHRLIGWLERRRDHRLARWSLLLINRAELPARFVMHRVTPGDLGLELTTLLSLASVGSFVFFGYLIALDPGELTPGDQRGQDFSNALRAPVFDRVAEIATVAGSLPLVATAVILTGALLILHRRALEGLAIWWGLVLSLLAVWICKGSIWQADPAGWAALGLVERPAPGGAGTVGATYPSAMAAYSVAWAAIAVALRHAVSRLAQVATLLTVAILISVAVGLAVIYQGEAWFSDAAGGLGLGVFTFSLAGVCALALDWLNRNRQALRGLRGE